MTATARVPTYVALLRAVNVGGRGVVTMDRVRAAFQRAGAHNVQTVLQSGNVIFDVGQSEVDDIVAEARKRIGRLIGAEPEVIVRSASQVCTIVDKAPFARMPPSPSVKLYVVFLPKAPRRKPALPLTSTAEALEVIQMTGREVFVVSRMKPVGVFGFPNAFVENRLGLPATSRNWSTVSTLAELLNRRG